MTQRPDAPDRTARPRILVVMGVSGSGKSTVAEAVARRLGWAFVDGDAFHSPEHVAKMHAGQPLTDADRAPWLARIADWIDARLAAGETGVVVCSALRRRYRDGLVRGRPEVGIVYLAGERALIERRLAARAGHFMPPALLDSQFATLEPPGPDENPIVVGIVDPPERVAARVVEALGGNDDGAGGPLGTGSARA